MSLCYRIFREYDTEVDAVYGRKVAGGEAFRESAEGQNDCGSAARIGNFCVHFKPLHHIHNTPWPTFVPKPRSIARSAASCM